MMHVPAAVKDAVASFQSAGAFTLFPPRPSESSSIYKWGVRVAYKTAEDTKVGWVCLASQNCRDNVQFIQLYSGKTSKATKHLTEVHKIQTDKTSAEATRKRTREEDLEELKNSDLITQDPKRMRVLMETRRIVFNNLPFRSVEYDESRILDDLIVKPEFQLPINAKMVTHTLIELYASAKHELKTYLDANGAMNGKIGTIVTDFWTCKVQHVKCLGVRYFFVNKDWELESVLLGTRRFAPTFSERDAGIRYPFRRWLEQLLRDFGLSTDLLFGGMSDSGSDVKRMLKSELKLEWEWCVAHMSNAATKMACGMVNNKKDSKNPGLTALIERICKTVRQVRDVEVMGSLFEALCELEGNGNAPRLLDYKSHRFLGLTVVVQRVLSRWTELEQWYYARTKKSERQNEDWDGFPLENDRLELVQLLSLLLPITILNKKSQGNGCSQVDVLLTLYRVRMQTLNERKPLRDYRSTVETPAHFKPNELTPLIAKTRSLLAAAFDRNFFSRYLDRARVRDQSFVFEIQLFLHPAFKNLDGNVVQVVQLCNVKRDPRPEVGLRLGHFVRDAIIAKARKHMLSFAVGNEPAPTPASTQQFVAYSEELQEMFGTAPAAEPPIDVFEGQIDEEIQRWRSDTAGFIGTAAGKPENILQFWRRQADGGNYKFLSKLARVVFGFPPSSAQIERDFGLAGMLVTKQRASMSSYNVEMASFLNCNRAFVNISQCARIPKDEIASHIPSHILVGALNEEAVDDVDANIVQFFSTASLEDADIEMD